MLQNRRHHPLPPSGVAPARELVSASCLVVADRQRRFELRAVPKHGAHDDGEPPGERDPRLSQGGPLGNGQRSVLQLQRSLVARQHDVRSLLIGRYLFFQYGNAVVFFGRFIAVLRMFAARCTAANR